MTNKFKEALDYFNDGQIETETIRLALRIAQAVTEEPSEYAETLGNRTADSLAVTVNGKGYIHDCQIAPDTFRAMVNQMIKEINNG